MGANESTPQSKEAKIELGEEYSHKSGVYKLWTRVHPCSRNKNNGTLFLKEFGVVSSASSDLKKYFDNGITSLRRLRHPCILQYVDAQFTPGEAQLFTERVQILDLCIDSQSPIEIRAGLRSILEALVFLHTTASISHNAVCPSSIFVSPDGMWRLGGFEFARNCGQTAAGTNDDHLLLSELFRSVKPAPFSPPEDQQAMRTGQPLWARDAYGFGRLIEYSIQYLEGEEDENVLSSLRDAVKRLCASDADERPTLVQCMDDPAFSNPLSEIENFVRTIQTKNEEEKRIFFDSSLSLLRSLPPRVVGRRLTRTLLSRYVMLEQRAHERLLCALMKPVLHTVSSDGTTVSLDGSPDSAPSTSSSTLDDVIVGLLPIDLYRETVLQECAHVLKVRDAAVRLAIMDHFESFAPHYSKEQLISNVLPEVLIGLEDADNRIVAATLKAMSVLVPLMGADIVLGRSPLDKVSSIGGDSRHSSANGRQRHRIFADGTPKMCSPLSTPLETPCASPPMARHTPSSLARQSLPSAPMAIQMVAAPTLSQPVASQITPLPTTVLDEEEGDETVWHDDGGWNDGWTKDEKIKDQLGEEIKDQSEETDRVVEVIKPVVVAKLSKEAIGTSQRQGKDIGAEFAVKVTVRNEIDDLFAEMQPEIKTAGSILSQLEELAALKSTVAEDTVDLSSSSIDKNKNMIVTKKESITTTRLNFSPIEETDDDGGDAWGVDDEDVLNLDDD